MAPMTWRKFLVLVLVTVFAAAACGSSDDADEASPTPAPTPAPSLPGKTTSTTDAAPGSDDLVGEWMADASALFAANTANLGDAPGLECSGPITLTFTAEGTFTHGGEASCGVGSIVATARIVSSGSYTAEGGTLTIMDSASEGTLDVGGLLQPLPPTLGDVAAEYEVDGDTLTITFTDPSVGTVSQVYTRV